MVTLHFILDFPDSAVLDYGTHKTYARIFTKKIIPARRKDFVLLCNNNKIKWRANVINKTLLNGKHTQKMFPDEAGIDRDSFYWIVTVVEIVPIGTTDYDMKNKLWLHCKDNVLIQKMKNGYEKEEL